MANDDHTPDAAGGEEPAQLDLFVPLKGESAVDYIAIKTEQMVTAKLAGREAKFHRNLSIMFSLAGLVGLGVIATLVQLTMDQAITDHVQRELAQVESNLEERFAEVEARVAGDAEQIRNTLILQDLALTIQAAELKDEIGKKELEEILQQIELIADKEEMTSQDQFATILGKIAVALVDQSELSSLIKLHEMLGPRLYENRSAALDVGSYFAYILVSEIVPPSEQPSETERTLPYLDQARRIGYPENYLFWNLLIELKNNGLETDDRTDSLMEGVSSLSAEDLKYFFRKVDVYAEVVGDSRREREVAGITNALRQRYAGQLSDLRASLPSEEENQSQQSAR